ncbi:type II toxin-antitoxin system death-on-curing family toxin [Mitsuokella sp. AF21-1AC]|uniref:type II toxin-antitoxin system death-on-curing family toxin n=1 Tax=Mitsuokella sp. AF21-1AC TaxID=2292235 RepID=UPI000E4EA9EB|nr:type II toxin-antitoxin system death-on-curing family toxin [Mitsuokella sp. AF21-1AC]RGS69631.1 type II toxin-antitoxin system death-on-curing family toxin [Mitsuokella sp. AF21-1AC]
MIRLTKHQVIQMHEELLSYTGGTEGVRDEGLLESALAAPFMMFSGTELFPSLEEKAARLCYGLVKNHAMVDGNKRIGAHCMLVFLAINGQTLTYTQEELWTIILGIASGDKTQNDLLDWIKQHETA